MQPASFKQTRYLSGRNLNLNNMVIMLESAQFAIEIALIISLSVASGLACLLLKAINLQSSYNKQAIPLQDVSDLRKPKDTEKGKAIADVGVEVPEGVSRKKINLKLSPLAISIYTSLYLAAIPYSMLLIIVYAISPISIPSSNSTHDSSNSLCLPLGLYSIFLQSLLFIGLAVQSVEFYLRLCVKHARSSFILARPRLVLAGIWTAAVLSSPWYLFLAPASDSKTSIIVPQASGILCSLDWTSKSSSEGVAVIAVNVAIILICLMCMMYCYFYLILSSSSFTANATNDKELDQSSIKSSKPDSSTSSPYTRMMASSSVRVKLDSGWIRRLVSFLVASFLCWMVYFCKVCTEHIVLMSPRLISNILKSKLIDYIRNIRFPA